MTYIYIHSYMEKAYTNRMRKQLIEKISELSSTEHDEIFKTIKDYMPDCNFTSNTNGFFFNTSSFSDELLHRIELFVNFCLENKKELDEYEKKLKECKLKTGPIDTENENNEGREIEKQVDVETIQPHVLPLSPLEMQVEANELASVLVKHLYTNERVAKKKMYTKFHASKKRFSKRIAADKRRDTELTNDLDTESS